VSAVLSDRDRRAVERVPRPARRRTTLMAMTPHEGICRLLLSEDGNTLGGDYQNDRHRQTYGMLSFNGRVAP
jgi:hypothetical protein